VQATEPSHLVLFVKSDDWQKIQEICATAHKTRKSL